MTSSVASDLDRYFNILQNSKPPGAQRGPVEAITNIALEHVTSESVVVSALARYLKRAPTTHKLGAIYIIDSVFRKWIEQAKKSGQLEVGSADEHGTYAAGIARIRDIIEFLVIDTIRVCPAEQREKLKRLVMIWERSQVLPAEMVQNFIRELESVSAPPAAAGGRSTTPAGSPPPGLVNGVPTHVLGTPPSNNVTPSAINPSVTPASLVQQPAKPAQPAADSVASILGRLSAIASSAISQTPTPASSVTPPNFNGHNQVPPRPPVPTAPAYNGNNNQSNGYASHGPFVSQPTTTSASSYSTLPAPASSLPAIPPASIHGLPPILPQPVATPTPAPAPTSAPAVTPTNPLTALQPAQAAALATLMSNPLFQSGGAMTPALTAILQTLALGNTAALAAPQPETKPQFQFVGRQPPTRPQADRDFGRSPPKRGRDRSRSPSDRNGHDNRNGHKSDYRERSPAPNGPSSNIEIRPKYIEYDSTIPQNHIRVLSRTLFIGGVNYSEQELYDIFAQFGEVQSCIVNKDKRHAFVKMLYRDTAVRAVEQMKSPEFAHYGLRTRWGVGFGPRDCSDYNTGVSVIPISSLTEADVKWMHTAQFGGCGDKEITSGMCVEEPDIEIGAGVSSKAISRRIQTDRGGSFGPRSTRSEMASVRPAANQPPPSAPTAPQAVTNGTVSGSQVPPTAPTGPQRGNKTTPPTAPSAPQAFAVRGGRGGHDGPSRGGRGRGGFRERGRPRRDFDTPQQFGQGFDYGANY